MGPRNAKEHVNSEERHIQEKYPNKNFGRRRNAKNVNHRNDNKRQTCGQPDRYLGKHLRRVCGKSKSENSKPDDPFKQIRTPGKKTDAGKTEIAKPNERSALFRVVDANLCGTDSCRERYQSADEHRDQHTTSGLCRGGANGGEKPGADDHGCRKEGSRRFSEGSRSFLTGFTA